MSTAFRAIALCALAIMTSACSSTQSSNTPVKPSTQLEGLPRTTNVRPGLELITWYVPESDDLDGHLMELTVPALDEQANEKLARHSLMLIRLSESDLPELVSSIGGTNATKSTWCGQVTDWRNLRDVPVKRTVIEIDSKTTLLDGGVLAVAARAWVEPTLESARMHLELVPRFRTDRRRQASILAPRATNTHDFTTLAEATDLNAGEVLILTSTAPPPPIKPLPPEESAPIENDPDPTDDPTLDTPVPSSKGRIRQSIELGHTLFYMPSQSPERVILVFVPRIPDSIFPPRAPGDSLRMSADSEVNQ